MLANLFYFCGLFLFLFQFLLISKFHKFLYLKEFFEKFEKVTNRKPQKEDFSEIDYQLYSFILLTNLFTAIWYFCGLIGSNWLVFLVYFISNPILTLITKSSKSKLLFTFVEFNRLVIVTLLTALLVINHFHLHLNLTKLILH